MFLYIVKVEFTNVCSFKLSLSLKMSWNGDAIGFEIKEFKFLAVSRTMEGISSLKGGKFSQW